ncbi:carbohydrate ABC transporter permease [Pseudactinotalea sp.]|uniref:carbohydrate ABC transporter permease n=1 Tax=Pseudactinotalea sp. TaxID=1926260 RepID=UPI003B3A74E8
MTTSRGERAANYVVLVAFAVFALAPIAVVLVTALSPSTTSPGGLSVFVQAWSEGSFSRYMLTSATVAIVVVSIAVLASMLAGYALGTMDTRGGSVIFALFLLGLMVPAEAIVVPLFYDMRALGLTNTLWAVALPQIAQSIAFGTYWMRAYFRSAPRPVMEAARLDGAGSWRTLWSVLVPIGRPAVVTLVLLVFMWTWNEFLIPLVMSPNGDFRTAPLALAIFKGQHVQATGLLAAAAVLVALPVVVLYLFLQRHFIRGMVEGAIRE